MVKRYKNSTGFLACGHRSMKEIILLLVDLRLCFKSKTVVLVRVKISIFTIKGHWQSTNPFATLYSIRSRELWPAPSHIWALKLLFWQVHQAFFHWTGNLIVLDLQTSIPFLLSSDRFSFNPAGEPQHPKVVGEHLSVPRACSLFSSQVSMWSQTPA